MKGDEEGGLVTGYYESVFWGQDIGLMIIENAYSDSQ
jgi:hypothetical protein